MEAMLALALDLSGWRGPVAFGAVGLFVVAALGRLISRIAARRRRRVWLSEGYKSREDVQIARREENIEDWLEKMRSTPEEFTGSMPAPVAAETGSGEKFVETVDMMIKEFSKGLEKVVSLEKPEVRASGPSLAEHGPERIYPKGYKPDFRFVWYRIPDGSLICRTIDRDVKVSDEFWHFMNHDGQKYVTSFENLRVAYPKVGEWWMKTLCPDHRVDQEVRIEVREEYSWYRSPERISELYCACLLPINFGKGFPKVTGSEYLVGGAGGDGGSALAGAGGSPGISVLEPKDKCTNCAGEGKVVTNVDGACQVVPCPRCKGFCWEP